MEAGLLRFVRKSSDPEAVAEPPTGGRLRASGVTPYWAGQRVTASHAPQVVTPLNLQAVVGSTLEQ